MNPKSMNKEDVLETARRLVQEAVEVADKAGIDPSEVVAPHCAETATTRDEYDSRASDNQDWCGVPVKIDNKTQELFEMVKPNADPKQKPAFVVTQSTASLVRNDFARYKPSLQRMAEDWQEDKKRSLEKKRNQ